MVKFNILLDIDNLTINDVENQNKNPQHNLSPKIQFLLCESTKHFMS